MGYPGRHNIYEATIRRMVLQALEQQERMFREEHESDTDTELLMYLRACAIRLHHSPWPGEIVGGSYIEERFESWNQHWHWQSCLLLTQQIRKKHLSAFKKKWLGKRRSIASEKRRRRFLRKRDWHNKLQRRKRSSQNSSVLFGLCDPPCTDL